MNIRDLFIPAFILFALLGFYATQSYAVETTEEIISGLLSNREEDVEKSLTYISENTPPQILPKIIEIILSREDVNKKNTALQALKYYSIKETLPMCIHILKKSSSFLVKKEIINYMATSNDRKIVIPIAMELKNPFFSVRESAILALKRIGDDRMFPYILNLMESSNPIYQIYALEAIHHLYDIRFYNFLINILKNKNKSIRYYALRCIEKNNLKDSLPYLRRIALRDSSWEVRVKAVQIIGDFRDKKSLYVLLRTLRDTNKEVRFATAKTLYILRLKASLFSLSNQLYSESDDEIKKVIIDTLIIMKNAGGYKGLKRVLFRDKNIMIKIRAAYALGSIRHRRSVSLLLRGLKDPDPKVRAEICYSLGNYTRKNVVIKLLMIINDDPERYVRTAALYAIKRIGYDSSILPLFNRYTIEMDPIFKEKLKITLRELIKKSIDLF